MISMRKYDRIMEHISLTDDMRRRILTEVEQADLTPRKSRPAVYRKLLPLAACLMILVAGAAGLGWHLAQSREPQVLVTTPEAVACSSAEKLSEVVAFSVSDLPELPFTVESRTYTAYQSQVAEIVYSGEEQTAVFRKSAGEGDNSGFYAVYDTTAQITVAPRVVTLQGSGGLYTMALWSDGAYTCTLRLSSGLPEETWRAILVALPEE